MSEQFRFKRSAAKMTYQRETLVAKLREYGVTYLAPSDAIASEPIPSGAEFINALLQQPDARLKLALIPLFLRQPDLAKRVPALVTELDSLCALDLQTYYMAAVYLQRRWKSRLGIYLAQGDLLPDLYSQQLGLPMSDEAFGKVGLYELAEAWKARSKYPFNRLAALNQTIDLFFEQLRLERPLSTYAPTR